LPRGTVAKRQLRADMWKRTMIERMRIETRSRAVLQATAAVLHGMPKSARQVVEEFVFVMRASTSYTIGGMGGLDPVSAMLASPYNDFTFKAYRPQVLVKLPIFRLFLIVGKRLRDILKSVSEKGKGTAV
jgi:hypothetical protein